MKATPPTHTTGTGIWRIDTFSMTSFCFSKRSFRTQRTYSLTCSFIRRIPRRFPPFISTPSWKRSHGCLSTSSALRRCGSSCKRWLTRSRAIEVDADQCFWSKVYDPRSILSNTIARPAGSIGLEGGLNGKQRASNTYRETPRLQRSACVCGEWKGYDESLH